MNKEEANSEPSLHPIAAYLPESIIAEAGDARTLLVARRASTHQRAIAVVGQHNICCQNDNQRDNIYACGECWAINPDFH